MGIPISQREPAGLVLLAGSAGGAELAAVVLGEWRRQAERFAQSGRKCAPGLVFSRAGRGLLPVFAKKMRRFLGLVSTWRRVELTALHGL